CGLQYLDWLLYRRGALDVW
nr:immunoglobulin heavy chain junction region [Macaca mulatta]MOV38721.1 immunoglobulin heavy chain junction region [Macaca mulatta]MOV38900.1 immunoglobulin heavy chain junction region [Macaca mulatta]MOV38970.1 immunoglobulin heavy chain junction region [Macaca mulatta]MOV40208.1 immunoglobulin heavy chain junction region [Macaca mulatta]